MPADRGQRTLLAPSAARSPGNLRRKTSTFSLMSEQFKQAGARGWLLYSERNETLGEPRAALTRPSQGNIRPWTDGQFLNS